MYSFSFFFFFFPLFLRRNSEGSLLDPLTDLGLTFHSYLKLRCRFYYPLLDFLKLNAMLYILLSFFFPLSPHLFISHPFVFLTSSTHLFSSYLDLFYLPTRSFFFTSVLPLFPFLLIPLSLSLFFFLSFSCFLP